MDFFTLLLIAISLSFDSFAVSVSSGIGLSRNSLKFHDAFKIAMSLAVFQAIMPVIGWWLGSTVKELVEQFDHWIAFGLLAFLGGQMIWESFHHHEEKVVNPTNWKILIAMSIATSIDALAVGISFAFIIDSMLMPTLLIWAVTFIFSLTGIYMGKKTGKKLARYAEPCGGIVLIAIGTKILIEHLLA